MIIVMITRASDRCEGTLVSMGHCAYAQGLGIQLGCVCYVQATMFSSLKDVADIPSNRYSPCGLDTTKEEAVKRKVEEGRSRIPRLAMWVRGS